MRFTHYGELAKLLGILSLTAMMFPIGHVSAEIVRMAIERREPFADGHCFGRTGPYERIAGRLYHEVAPEHVANARVADLKLAPQNARGKVEFWSDFYLLKPADPSRGNGRLLYDVHNRGNKLVVWTLNDSVRSNDPATLDHAGNGFLMHHGYSILWSGCNGDVMDDGTGRLLAGLPIARQRGKSITGRNYVEICVDEKVYSRPFYWSPWGTSAAYPSISLDNRSATLTMRPKRSEPAIEIPHDAWGFARWEDGKVTPDPAELHVKEGFRPGWLYELVYTAKEPRVAGLGLAGLRDCVAFFRFAEKDCAGTANPLSRAVKRAYVFGISQSGRLIHHFLYDGFNTDEGNRLVFDGAIIHVAGSGKGLFNSRFGMATVYGTYHCSNLYPADFFPFAPMPQTDPVTGIQADSLARPRAHGHVPKIFFVQTSTEYWSRAASLLHTDVEGKKDMPVDPNVRIYSVAGAQHLGGGPPTRGICQNPRNVLNDRPPVLRALLVAMDRWVSDGDLPPSNRHPRIDDGTLVDLATFHRQFPRIPGVRLPDAYYMPLRLDPGPRWFAEGIADVVPPKAGPPCRTLVPAVDTDGNELAGIRLPDVAVPLGTYSGWNLRAAQYGAEGLLAGLHGTYLKFAQTPEERRRSNDPRPSILERYPTREAYLAQVTDAVLRLHSEGLLLDQDAVEILKIASERNLWETE